MGYLEYAWSLFFEKDESKAQLLMSPKIQYAQLSQDKAGFVCTIPEPRVIGNEEEEQAIALMGYCFPDNALGKTQLASLFRAAVFHLGAHALSSNFEAYEEWKMGKNPRLANFTISLIKDVKANAYIYASHADKLIDVAFANTLALMRMRQINSLINPATKVMAGLLVGVNTGVMRVESKTENKTVTRLVEFLKQFKDKTVASSKNEKVNLNDERLEIADEIYCTIEDVGPITEDPFFPHTEKLGVCSIFSPTYCVNSDITLENNFKECLKFLGGSLPTSKDTEQTWRKVAEAEAIQVFDTWKQEKEKEKETTAKYQNLLLSTRFKSVEIPQPDYTRFVRTKIYCKSEAHRLIESLLVARDAIDEDPRKMYGVLDLQDVIQVIASKNPRMDVFMLDENISKSYSWIILLDASKSMECIRDFALELYIMLAEVANELLSDPTSWGMYAFNDRFLVVKDLKERYNARVKSRIGGIRFEGFTYMPDALGIAGQIIKTRAENLRLITVISDGWPYGYPDINAALSDTVNTLDKGSISVIGIGAKTRRMELLFKSSCTIHTHRDLSKKFSNLYLEASRVAIEK